MRRLFLCLAFGWLALAPVHAQEDRALTDNGRFTMTPAPGGFLRLDTSTGAVSLCTVVNGRAECRMAADDRAALLDEIDRLRKDAPPAPRGLLPGKQDMDQALDYMEQFMRRMKRIMQDDKP